MTTSIKDLIIENYKNEIINDFNSLNPDINIFINDILNNYSFIEPSLNNDIQYLYPSIHLLIYLLNNYNIYHQKSNKKSNIISLMQDKKLLKYFKI